MKVGWCVDCRFRIGVGWWFVWCMVRLLMVRLVLISVIFVRCWFGVFVMKVSFCSSVISVVEVMMKLNRLKCCCLFCGICVGM